MLNDALKNTGLTQAELAELFGVSRITVNAWLKGRFNPHPLHRERIQTIAQKIEAAVTDGRLPLPEGLSRTERISAAQTAILAV